MISATAIAYRRSACRFQHGVMITRFRQFRLRVCRLRPCLYGRKRAAPARVQVSCCRSRAIISSAAGGSSKASACPLPVQARAIRTGYQKPDTKLPPQGQGCPTQQGAARTGGFCGVPAEQHAHRRSPRQACRPVSGGAPRSNRSSGSRVMPLFSVSGFNTATPTSDSIAAATQP